MKQDTTSTTHTISALFLRGIITAPLNIRANLGDRCVDAVLLEDGSVQIEAHHHPDIHQAMLATHRDSSSTSDAWQFWCWLSDKTQIWNPLEHLRATLNAQSSPTEIRTSDSHPLRIDYISVPHATGRIGLTFCPGKHCEGLYGGTWQRDLNKDLTVIETSGGKVLVSLMEGHEFPLLGLPEFAEALAKSSIEWLHLPIQDMNIPTEQFEQQWTSIGPDLHQRLVDGDTIIIHCRGGLGRTGLLAARMLVEAGLAPADAVANVRSAREHAIETYAQEHYVLHKRWALNKR